MARGPRQKAPDDREHADLAALADGSIAPDRRAAAEARVAASPELAARLAEQQRAVELVRSAVAEVDAPESLRGRVERQRAGGRAVVPRRPALIGAVAAATAAVVVGVAVFSSDPSGEELYAALAPTSLAPGATGEATLTKTSSGWRIELDASGLPRLDDGRFYQAWLRDAGGVLVPVGTFNEGTDVTLWAGVSPNEFTALTVTREQADGDQASSGERVLAGPVDTDR